MTEPPPEMPESPEDESPTNERLAGLIHSVIEELGEDPSREGLLKTPERVSRSLEFLTSGYRTDVEQMINGAIFEDDNDEMVVQRDIPFFSLCEHHMLPFFGMCHVAYLPKGKVVGLSKIARLVDIFSRRLQIQERLTRQIARCLEEHLQPLGVAVVMEGHHLCMTMRGVQKAGSITVTSAMQGAFKSDARTRAEFLALTGKSGSR
jgi:GTP cyclohydrolase I